MDPTELDAYLRRHTEHEERYLAGWSSPETSRLFADKGMDEPRISIADIQSNISSTRYFFKKHSRFSQYPEHVQEWVELEYMYAGSCVEYVRDMPIELREGQCLLLDQNTLHKPPLLSEEQILVNFMLAPDSIADLLRRADLGRTVVGELLVNTLSKTAHKNSYILFASEGSWRMRSLVEAFCCDYLDGGPYAETRLEAIVHLMLCELADLCREGRSSASLEKVDQISVLPALRLIERRYASLTLEDAADELGISPTYLSRLLKRRTGSSFQRLLVRQRMSEAARLLHDPSLSVTEVAKRVGYENVTFFYRKFEAEFGCTPGEWRER